MSIDPARWRRFARESAPRFGELVYLDGILGDPTAVANLIDGAIRTATVAAPRDLKIRAFRQGAFDYRLTDALTSAPLAAEETANHWLARVAGDRGACVAVNDVSTWSFELSGWAQSAIGTLLLDGRYELPSGSDIYTFVADSEWTPFGIHQDAEPSLIFHLGPSSKEVWVWPDGTIDPRAFSSNPSFGQLSFDVEAYLLDAEHFVLDPGDFLCIPKDTFHLFRNLGRSTFLGITLYPIHPRTLVTDAFWRTIRNRFAAPDPSMSGAAVVEQIAASLDAFAGIEALQAAMRREAERAQLARRTAGYVSALHPSATQPGTVATCDRFRWSFRGVIAVIDSAGATDLVVRGRSIRLGRRLDFADLIRMVDLVEEFGYDELAKVLPEELDGTARHRLIQNLHQLGAFTHA